MNGADPSSARRLRLEISASAAFAATIAAVHAGAAACIAAALPGPAGIALAGLVFALGLAAAWDRALLRGSRSPRCIEIQPSGEALLVFANGNIAAVEPVHGIGITRHWVALASGSPRRRGVLVTAGMLGDGPFRLLRLWALWGRVPGAVSGQPRV